MDGARTQFRQEGDSMDGMPNLRKNRSDSLWYRANDER
jgi:hypothetical protein